MSNELDAVDFFESERYPSYGEEEATKDLDAVGVKTWIGANQRYYSHHIAPRTRVAVWFREGDQNVGVQVMVMGDYMADERSEGDKDWPTWNVEGERESLLEILFNFVHMIEAVKRDG